MKQRRSLMLVLAAGFACLIAPLRAQTPSAGLRRVGVLAPSTQAKEAVTLAPFFDEMRRLGWIEGTNIAYDRVYANDHLDALDSLAAELVARKPEVIYAPPTVAAVAAKRATQTVPIVFGVVSDPVTLGLITSLAHPRGNVTGVISFADSLAPKRIELLREMMPTVKRIGLLGDSTDPTTKSDLRAMMPLAVSLGLTLVVADTANPDDIDAAMAKLAANRVDVIYLYGGTTLAFNMRGRLLEVANRMRLPVVGARSQMADAGAIFSYGPSLIDQLRRSAPLVDKILKGANPGDMPVEQATLFELVINAKAAKALGITISQSILLRADRVIE